MWWGQLPNLSHLAAVRSGVVDNFGLEVESRKEQVGLQFNGFVQITNDAFYTFYTRSDDGSRLFIGDSSLQVKTVGRAALPETQPVANTSIPSEKQEFQWTEIEGIVSSVNDLGNALELELITDSGHVRVKVAENSGCSFTLAPQNLIRAVGVCRNVFSLDGRSVPGEFFVQSWNDINQSYVTPDLWAKYPLMTISNVLTMSLQTGLQPVVHVRGKIAFAGPGQPAYMDDGSGRILLETIEPDYVGGRISEMLGGSTFGTPIRCCVANFSGVSGWAVASLVLIRCSPWLNRSTN